MEFISQPWAWYVAGPIIAIIMFLLFYFGEKFGVSSNLETFCSIGGAGKFIDYFKIEPLLIFFPSKKSLVVCLFFPWRCNSKISIEFDIFSKNLKTNFKT